MLQRRSNHSRLGRAEDIMEQVACRLALKAGKDYRMWAWDGWSMVRRRNWCEGCIIRDRLCPTWCEGCGWR
jgi:hypothetical protein